MAEKKPGNTNKKPKRETRRTLKERLRRFTRAEKEPEPKPEVVEPVPEPERKVRSALIKRLWAFKRAEKKPESLKIKPEEKKPESPKIKPEEKKPLGDKERILIGGLGGLTPTIWNFVLVDFYVLYLNPTACAIIGYALKVILFFWVGAIVVWAHKKESNHFKAFELGILAPALLTASINGSNIEVPRINTPPTQIHSAIMFFTPPAYAQTTQEEIEIKSFSYPGETFFEQLWRGLSGSTSDKLWFVIAGKHVNLEDAKDQARQINQGKKGFKAVVYRPYDGDLPYFSVVIGENLTNARAVKCRFDAIDAGLPKDMFIWTFPK